MSYFDGRAPRDRIPVERKQTLSTEHFEDGAYLASLSFDGGELGSRDPAPSVPGTLAEGDQPEKDLASRCPSGIVETDKKLLGSTA